MNEKKLYKIKEFKRNESVKKDEAIFLICPKCLSSDIVYKVIAKEGIIYFCKVGGQFYDIKKIHNEYNTDTIEENFAKDKHNFKITAGDISSVITNTKKSVWTGALQNSGTVILTIGNRKHKFIIHPIQGIGKVANYFKNTVGISVEMIDKEGFFQEKKEYRSMIKEPGYKTALKITRITNTLAYILCFWAIIYPKPYLLIVIANIILPVVGIFIYIKFKDYVNLDERKEFKRPNIAVTSLFPSIILAYMAIDLNIIYSGLLWLYISIVIILIYIVIIKNTDEYKKRKSILILILFFAAPYAFGVTTLSNCVFDHSSPICYSTLVIDKYIENGRVTTRYLKVEPWGPISKKSDIDVPKKLYEKTQKGDKINIYLKKGALGIKWFIPENKW